MSARVPACSPSIIAFSRHLHRSTHSRLSTATYGNLRTRSPSFIVRPLSYSARYTYPRKNSQDKDSINTEATEYSKSATDDEGARQEDAAFSPDVTQPEEEMDLAGKNIGVNTQPQKVTHSTIVTS